MLPAGGGNAVPVLVGAATNCEPSGHRSATTSRALSALRTTPEMLESFELTFPTTLPAASHGSRSCISRFNSASAAARFRVAMSPASSRELDANSIPRASGGKCLIRDQPQRFKIEHRLRRLAAGKFGCLLNHAGGRLGLHDRP